MLYTQEQSKTMRLLKQYKHRLTFQQYKTIKGQIEAGDCEGASKGLEKLLRGDRREK